MGKYGPYIKCGNDFRSVKSSVELFNITESEAREIFNAPKDSGKKTASKGRAASSAKRSSSAEAVVDFGEYEGKSLGIYHGRYGYYLRHGESNVRISKEYQQDEEACKAMSRETAISFLK